MLFVFHPAHPSPSTFPHAAHFQCIPHTSYYWNIFPLLFFGKSMQMGGMNIFLRLSFYFPFPVYFVVVVGCENESLLKSPFIVWVSLLKLITFKYFYLNNGLCHYNSRLFSFIETEWYNFITFMCFRSLIGDISTSQCWGFLK